jgi:hypothetical protein
VGPPQKIRPVALFTDSAQIKSLGAGGDLGPPLEDPGTAVKFPGFPCRVQTINLGAGGCVEPPHKILPVAFFPDSAQTANLGAGGDLGPPGGSPGRFKNPGIFRAVSRTISLGAGGCVGSHQGLREDSLEVQPGDDQ